MPERLDNPVPTPANAALTQDDLTQIMDAYGAVTERLRHTQEKLTGEVRRLQHELASANTEVVRAKRLAALGEMATGIAHEVRNPLASIRLFATMLEEDLEHMPVQQDIAAKIGSAVRGLDAIVGDVLTFAREMKLSRTTATPRAIFSNALDAAAPLILQSDIAVRWAIEDETLDVWHDPGLVHQALLNLIRNAAQAMSDGGVLTLGACTSDELTQLIVADTGAGISEDQIDRIFNPFFTTRATGTGLGLPIVHRIADAHGGTIAVHNEGGAVFTLSLPTAPAGHDNVAVQATDREPEIAAPTHEQLMSDHHGVRLAPAPPPDPPPATPLAPGVQHDG
ncbi:MAG: sensor histidine kinase [Planctomycetota bacterium]